MFGYDPSAVILCSDSFWCSITHPILASLIVFFTVLTGFAYTTLLERKFLAFFQQRSGPNRVGPGGFLQPAADGLKLIFKEDIIPSEAYKVVYYIAPILKTVPYIILFAVLPWGPMVNIPWFDGNWYRVLLGIADVNVGILWLLAISSIATYGVVLAGWSSNNKYAMMGGLRASAQMISYELSLGLMIAVPVMIVGSMSIQDIIQYQLDGPPVLGWFIFQNPLAAGILAIALVAEVSRAPFDLPEAEQELTQGFLTEYSGMKFAIMMMAEYLGMIAISMIFVSLYLGGWGIGGGIVESMPLLAPLVMIGKIIAVLLLQIWVRATLPRFRYDRLMSFGWKVLLPLAFVAVAWTGISVVVGETTGSPIAYGIVSSIFFVLLVIGAFLIFREDSERRVVEPSTLADDPMVTGERKGLVPLLVDILGVPIYLLFQMWEKIGASITSARRRTAEELRDFSSTYSATDDDNTDEKPPAEAASGD